jgi:hypothetical protein
MNNDNDNFIHPLLHSLHPVAYQEENTFSKKPCDCCGNPKAGQRTQVEAIRHSDNPKDNGIALLLSFYDVCNGCLVRFQ